MTEESKNRTSLQAKRQVKQLEQARERELRKQKRQEKIEARKKAAAEAQLTAQNTAQNPPPVGTPAAEAIAKDRFIQERTAELTAGISKDSPLYQQIQTAVVEREYAEQAYLAKTLQKARDNGFVTVANNFEEFLKCNLKLRSLLGFNIGLAVWLDRDDKTPKGFTREQMNDFISAIRYPEQKKVSSAPAPLRPELINCYFDLVRCIVCAWASIIIAGKLAKWTDKTREPNLFDLAGSKLWEDVIRQQVEFINLRRLLVFMYRYVANIEPGDGKVSSAAFQNAKIILDDLMRSASTSCQNFLANKSTIINSKGNDKTYDIFSSISSYVGKLFDSPKTFFKELFTDTVQNGLDFISGDSEESARNALEDLFRNQMLLVRNETIVSSGGFWNVDDRILQGLDLLKSAYYRGTEFTRENSRKLEDKIEQNAAEAKAYITNDICNYMENFVKFNNKLDALSSNLVQKLIGNALSVDQINKFISDNSTAPTAQNLAETVAKGAESAMLKITNIPKNQWNSFTKEQKDSLNNYIGYLDKVRTKLTTDFLNNDIVKGSLDKTQELWEKVKGGLDG